MILQTSTNASGPFEDIGAPSGSRTFAFSEPMRFFRLRSAAKGHEALANF